MAKIKEKLKKIDFLTYGIIFTVSVILMSFLLFNKNNYVLGHDTTFHISNILAMKQTIVNGNFFFPKIVPLIANNFGYGTFLFYGPLPHTITALVSIVADQIRALSIINIMKIVQLMGVFLSGVFMYQFVHKITKKKSIGLLSAIIYITSPYFLSDIYVRNAYAESFVFIFFPLIFNGLYELLFLKNKQKFYKLFIPGVSLLILTHTSITLFMALIVIGFLLINYKKTFNKETIKSLGCSLFIILLMTSFYLIPLLEQKISGNIQVFQEGAMTSIDLVMKQAITPDKLLFGQSFDGIRFFFLAPCILLFIITIIYYKKIKVENKNIFMQFLLIGLFLTFMSTKLFPWKLLPSVFLFIQFPWRLLSFITFFLSIVTPLSFMLLSDKFEKIMTFIAIIIVTSTSLIFINKKMIKPLNLSSVNPSTMGMGAAGDYFPVKTLNNMSYYNNRKNDAIILDGQGEVSVRKELTPTISYNFNLESDETVVELPLLYYKGYTSSCPDILEKNSVKHFPIEESPNGFVQITLNKHCKSKNATINYTGTNISKASYIISILTFLGFILTLLRRR